MIFGLFKYQPLRIAAYNYDYPLWGHIFGKLSVHLFEKNAVNKLNSSEFNGFQMRIFQQSFLPPFHSFIIPISFKGWFLSLSSMLCIPVYAIYIWVVTEGTISEVHNYFHFSFVGLQKLANSFQFLGSIH